MAVPSEEDIFGAPYLVLPWPISLATALNFHENDLRGVLRYSALCIVFVFTLM